MPNNLLRIQGFNTDDAGISFYKPDGTVYRLSFISDGSLRYGKFINGAWTGVGNVLTNDDIDGRLFLARLGRLPLSHLTILQIVTVYR